MGFSILIPVFNWDVNKLVEDLSKQASIIDSNFQILLIDDCSDLSCSYLNKKVALKENVDYQILTKNIGRSAIRNLLIERSLYEKCIFLDCDVSIIHEDFLANYLEKITDKNVVIGGHVYTQKKPIDSSKRLHWLYGTKKESRDAFTRSKKPYSSFMSSNFASTKKVFKDIKFDENIQGYGHEDTMFGIHLEDNKIPILHIENPVQHDGLEDAKIFLRKQEQAVKNLKHLFLNSTVGSKVESHSRLISIANKSILNFIFKPFHAFLEKQLLGLNPKIWQLQLLKIVWWNRD